MTTASTVPEPGGRTYTLLGADRRLYRSAVPGRFGGHRKSRIMAGDCPAALRAIVGGGYGAHRVFFADERTAVAAGYRPCAVCLPCAYAAWKARCHDDNPCLAEESIYQRVGARTRLTRVTSACSNSRSFCLRFRPPA